MDFVKAHYEKVVLSVVLLGLAAAAALMPITVSKEREKEQQRQDILIQPKVKELQPIDLQTNKAAVARLDQPKGFKFAGDHNLFNPVRWQKRPDGGVFKGTDAGVNALQVTNITPLRLRITFDEVTGDASNLGYQISVLNELQNARATPRVGRLKQRNNLFTIQEIKGDPANPSELVVLIEGDKAPVTISKEKPYVRIVGYSADMVYPHENRNWRNQKKDDKISFAGETYKVVAITPTQVVLSAESNKKQTIKEYQQASR